MEGSFRSTSVQYSIWDSAWLFPMKSKSNNDLSFVPNFSWAEPNTFICINLTKRRFRRLNKLGMPISIKIFGAAYQFFSPVPAWNFDFKATLQRLWSQVAQAQRASALLRNIQNRRICMGKNLSFSFRTWKVRRLIKAQVAQARNMSMGEHRHCCVNLYKERKLFT